jgi:hypothetical protein
MYARYLATLISIRLGSSFSTCSGSTSKLDNFILGTQISTTLDGGVNQCICDSSSVFKVTGKLSSVSTTTGATSGSCYQTTTTSPSCNRTPSGIALCYDGTNTYFPSCTGGFYRATASSTVTGEYDITCLEYTAYSACTGTWTITSAAESSGYTQTSDASIVYNYGATCSHTATSGSIVYFAYFGPYPPCAAGYGTMWDGSGVCAAQCSGFDMIAPAGYGECLECDAAVSENDSTNNICKCYDGVSIWNALTNACVNPYDTSSAIQSSLGLLTLALAGLLCTLTL